MARQQSLPAAASAPGASCKSGLQFTGRHSDEPNAPHHFDLMQHELQTAQHLRPATCNQPTLSPYAAPCSDGHLLQPECTSTFAHMSAATSMPAHSDIEVTRQHNLQYGCAAPFTQPHAPQSSSSPFPATMANPQPQFSQPPTTATGFFPWPQSFQTHATSPFVHARGLLEPTLMTSPCECLHYVRQSRLMLQHS